MFLNLKKLLSVMLVGIISISSLNISFANSGVLSNPRDKMDFISEESISTVAYSNIQNHTYNDINNILGISDEFINYLQEIKEANPGLNGQDLVSLVEEGLYSDNIMPLSISYTDAWSILTFSEKAFLVLNPTLINPIQMAVNEANTYTVLYYGHNLMGDPSDAYRHAVWNALMAKYIGAVTSKSTGLRKAEEYANAHEDHPIYKMSEPSLDSNKKLDGYVLNDHRNMDLYNNKRGRDIFDANSTMSSTSLAKKVYDSRSSLVYLYTY